MCDYSLEMYRSRPAVANERLQTHRFTSGSIGFTAPGKHDVATCLACDTKLELSQIPAHVKTSLDISGDKHEAVFVRIEGPGHHDGVRFINGREATLQQLGPGVIADVIDIGVEPIKPGRKIDMVAVAVDAADSWSRRRG